MKMSILLEVTSDDDLNDSLMIFSELAMIYKTKRNVELQDRVKQLEGALLKFYHGGIHKDLYAYAIHLRKTRWKSIEPALVHFAPHQAMEYAALILKRRWPELEEALESMDSMKMWEAYSKALLNGKVFTVEESARFNKQKEQQKQDQMRNFKVTEGLLLETNTANYPISHDDPPHIDLLFGPRTIATIAAEVIGTKHIRYSKCESLILKDARACLFYAEHGLQRRWKLAEPLISKHPMEAVKYCGAVINMGKHHSEPRTRFTEAEDAIAEDCDASIAYINAIRERFIAAEPKIFKSPMYKERYLAVLKRNNVDCSDL